MAKKYNIVLSDQAKGFRKGLSKAKQKEFDSAMDELSTNPLKDANPVSGGLMVLLGILDEIGVNTITMKMNKTQKAKFNQRAKEIFGDEYKARLKSIASELKD